MTFGAVLRYYQNPASIDSRLATLVFDFMYTALYVHCIMGFYMIGDSDIFQNYLLLQTRSDFVDQSGWFFYLTKTLGKYIESGAFLYLVCLFFLIMIQVTIYVRRHTKGGKEKGVRREREGAVILKTKAKKLTFFERVPADTLYQRIRQIDQKVLSKTTTGSLKKALVTQRIRFVKSFETIKFTNPGQFFVGVCFYRVEVDFLSFIVYFYMVHFRVFLSFIEVCLA
jgi:hypothetical protein